MSKRDPSGDLKHGDDDGDRDMMQLEEAMKGVIIQSHHHHYHHYHHYHPEQAPLHYPDPARLPNPPIQHVDHHQHHYPCILRSDTLRAVLEGVIRHGRQ